MKKTRITEGAGKSSTPLPKKTTPKAGASKTLQQSAAKKAKGRSDKFKAVNKKAGIKGLKENRFNPRLRKENSVIDNDDIRDRGDDVLDKPTRTEPSTVKVQVTFKEKRQLLQTTASVLHEIGFDAGDLEHSRSFDLYGPGVWIYEFLSTTTYDDVMEKYPELAKFEDSTLSDKESASVENIDVEDLSLDGLRDFLNNHLEDALYASADGVSTQFRGTGLTIEGSKEQVKKALAFVYNTEPEDISDEDINDALVESARPRRAGRRLAESKGAGKSVTPLPKKTTPKAGASKTLQQSAAKKAKGKSDKFKKVNKKDGIKGLKESTDPRMSAYSQFLDFSSPLRYLSEGYSPVDGSEYPQGIDGDIKAALDENIGEIETAAHGLIQEIIASDWLNNALANLDVDAFDDTDKIEGLIRAKVIEVLSGGVNESLEGLEDEEPLEEDNEFDTRSAIYNNAKEQGRVWDYLGNHHDDFLEELFPDGNPSGQNVESILNNFDVSVPGVSREDLITFLEVVVEEGI